MMTSAREWPAAGRLARPRRWSLRLVSTLWPHSRGQLYIPAAHRKLIGRGADDSWTAVRYTQVAACAALKLRGNQRECDDGDGDGIRGRRGSRTSHRWIPARAAGALLPDAGLGSRRRGPAAGDVPARVAGT